MKKKFSIVLAAILVVCTCAIALVACAPKNPDPFTAVDSSAALNDLWDAWAKKNMTVSGNTLGINAKVDLKNADADLSVILQGGISQDTKNDVLRLAIANNKKTGDNKNIVDIIINSANGLFVNIDGLSNKPIKIEEIKLPSIGDLLNGMGMSIGGLSEIVKPAIVELINSSLDSTKVVVDPVKNGQKYDVTYTFTAQVSKIIDAIIEIAVQGDITPETESVIAEVKNIVGGINLQFTAKTTGNDRIKVKKPAKGAPKYDYRGGEITELNIDVAGMDVNATGISLSNNIPAISIPTDTISLDKALLTSRLNGKITLRDSNGKSVGDYTYTINLDFEPIQLITTITDCVAQQSADPIIKKMLLDQKGKIFIEVNHTCGTSCKTTHVGGKKMDGSIIAIAFSPEDFGNRRVYVSLDLQTIVNDSLLSDMIGISLNSLFPAYYTQFSFDLVQYMDLIKTRTETPTTTPEATPEVAAMGLGLVSDNSPFSIGNMVTSIIRGLKDDQELQIKLDDVRSILDEFVRPMLKESDPSEGTYWTILKAVNSLFQGVDSIAIDGVYSNGESYDNNILELYKRKNANEMKEFCDASKPDEHANHKIIKGEVTDWDKDDAGNVKIYQGKSNDLNSNIYESNGQYKTISYGELMELVVDKYSTSEKNTVVIRFTDINGELVESRMNIIEIAGLAPNVYTEQEVSLVLSAGNAANRSAGIGSNINNIIGALQGFSTLVPQLAMLKELATPEVVVKTNITISEVESVVWDQTKVSGITEAQKHNSEKIYANGNDLSDKHHLTVTFVNGTVHEADVQANNTSEFVKNNKVTAWGTFTMQFAAFGYTEELEVKMNDALGVDNQTISLLLSGGSVTHKISSSVKNNVIGGSMKLQEGETMNVVAEFANANGFTYEATSSFLGWNGVNITFNKVGTYNLSLKGAHNAVINFKFIITENHVDEELYLGMSKEFVGKIGNYEFTKEELEKVASANTNANMKITVGGTDSQPIVKFDFTKTGKYSVTLIDKNGEYVIVNFNVTDASKTVSGLALNTDCAINLKEQFVGVAFEKEVIQAAVEKFNTDYAGKITMTFNNDMENPILTINAIDTNGYSGYIMNIVGNKGEIIKLTIKFNTNKVKKSGVINSQVNVKMSEMGGITYTKEEIDTIVANWNKNATNAGKMTVVVEEDLSLTFTLKKVAALGHTFKVTNKCDITIVVTEAEA